MAAASLVHKADFERLLATPPRWRSAHFAVHHVAGKPSAPRRAGPKPAAGELSTSTAPPAPEPVDDLPGGCWLGSVIPKRHARRAVTRNLLKRQVRAALARHAQTLPAGLWLVRLKAPFVPGQFASAASDALRVAARGELDTLFTRAGAPR
jgi:ribonuclease P protein component